MKLVEMSMMLNGVSNVSFNNDIIDKINQIKSFYTGLFESLAKINLSDTGKSNLYWITNDLRTFISVIASFDIKTSMRGEKLGNTIDRLYDSAINQKQAKIFADNTRSLAAYVRTINSINVNSTNALTALVRELNTLGVRLGNIDKLTDALANKLAEVLKHLVEKLQESKETIDKADEMQEKRQKLIEDSIHSITEMLDKPLQVNIKAESNPDDENPSPQST